jgi:spore maturation protein CgeB
MRVLIVDTWYPHVLEKVYNERPGLTKASYDEQWRAVMGTFFGTADSYSHHLGELGHVAHEVVVNCEPLQAAWLRESGQPLRSPRFRRIPHRDLVLLAQSASFRPDVVYVQDVAALAPATLRRLRRDHLLVGQIATELPTLAVLRLYDFLVSSFPHYVARLPKKGIPTEYLRIGFEPRVLDHLDATAQSADATIFVGALGRIQHAESNGLLARAAEMVTIDFYGLGVEEWPEDSPIRRGYRGEAFGLDMYRLLHSAKIALNRHGGVAEGYANNMRLYEATGVGTLLLTDVKQNLHELFEPEVELVTYSSAEEAAEKIRYYLEHEDERASIAAAGQARTLAEHTYAHRMRELEQILNRNAK